MLQQGILPPSMGIGLSQPDKPKTAAKTVDELTGTFIVANLAQGTSPNRDTNEEFSLQDKTSSIPPSFDRSLEEYVVSLTGREASTAA